ncbi:hypothetical protein OIDMADRAFT_19141 [Oidiodendron maius Zn]|uniref:Acid phosphatase n=1 Tax=Oidiodendron maius (strain Zn) TaxID=913774 RepID=A0A0C3DGR8_OIDMZ|nr:hypothetical protein OIDMADRAFT_19141 [Oidiodendron maius Zn]
MYLQTVTAIAVALAGTANAYPRDPSLTSRASSIVKGKTFDRFVSIWLENTDYSKAAADPNLKWIASQGITLTNYRAITHPSQPNYIASAGGSTHGFTSDNAGTIDASVQTIVDLLEAKGISWAEYEQDMPSSGYTGNYNNPKTGANDYVRKHNPLISYDSINTDPSRLDKIKNFTLFESDLAANALPQWMFITPNMTNDGHDTSVTTAGAWSKSFLQPLLSNSNFLGNTLVLLTFDETESYISNNDVFSVLLGDAVPTSSHGTTDGTEYTHYSMLSTVENNWDLGNLGQGDVGAAIFF